MALLQKLSFLILIFGFLSPAQAEEYKRWNLLAEKSQDKEEYLSYRLAYQGFLTGFVWMDLADVAIISATHESRFLGKPVCESRLRLSTEDYGFAEKLHPVRYQWRSLTSPGLDQTYIMDISDIGKSDNHNVTWADWDKKKIHRYRKRQLKQDEPAGWTFESDDSVADWYWEKDDGKALPAFLAGYPPVNEGTMSYFIHDDTKAIEVPDPAIGPLVMVRKARSHDFDQEPMMSVAVIAEDKIEQYKIELLGKEDLEVGKTTVPAIKLKSSLLSDPEGNEGWMLVWLSDDAARIPLSFQVEAPFGKMRVQITEDSLKSRLGTDRAVPACMASR